MTALRAGLHARGLPMSIKLWAAMAALALVTGASALAEPTPAPIHPALFVARDADSTLYLFGTVHLRPRGAPWGGPEAVAALAQADEVWTELDMSPEADIATQAQAIRHGFDSEGRTLASYLTPAETRRLDERARKFGVPLAQIATARPWFASAMLFVALLAQAGYDADAGVDRRVDAAADAAGKQRRWLETGAAQYAMLNGLSEEAQTQMLRDVLREDALAELQRLEAAWEEGDLPALTSAIIDKTRTEQPEVYEATYRTRTRAWTAVLAREMDGAGVDFVAVGAGHMVGPDSVVAMLRARGFTVERVSPAAE
jgi:uncharacterized protein YbaP (TraB family)